MGNNTFKRFILALFCTLMFTVGASAQAAADAKYNEGMRYQQKMTIADQNRAIACFRSAKRMYDSPKSKRHCDTAIGVSVSIKRNLGSGGGKRGGKSNRGRSVGNGRVNAQPTITVSNDYFKIEPDINTLSVTVTTNADAWDVNTVSSADGTDFLTAKKKDDDTFEIYCEKNTSTSRRSQKVEVTAGDHKKDVIVEQDGRPVILRLGENLWECSWRGGRKTLDVYCNSETTVKENNEQNWRVASKPQWVSVTFATKKKQGLLGKVGNFAKKLVKGEAEVDDDPTMKATQVNVVVEKIKGGSPELAAGRKGEVVFVSDDQRAVLMIVQNGK